MCYKNHTRTPVTQTSCNVEILALWAPYKSVQMYSYKPPESRYFSQFTSSFKHMIFYFFNFFFSSLFFFFHINIIFTAFFLIISVISNNNTIIRTIITIVLLHLLFLLHVRRCFVKLSSLKST